MTGWVMPSNSRKSVRGHIGVTRAVSRVGASLHDDSHSDQVRQAARVQFFRNMGAVQFDGPKADPEMTGDDLVGLAGRDQPGEEAHPVCTAQSSTICCRIPLATAAARDV